jgi:hypothetical protein
MDPQQEAKEGASTCLARSSAKIHPTDQMSAAALGVGVRQKVAAPAKETSCVSMCDRQCKQRLHLAAIFGEKSQSRLDSRKTT